MTTNLKNRDYGIINSYLSQNDWRVNENSNMGFSLQGLNVHISSDMMAHYWLSEIYTDEIRESHIGGDFHLHDLGLLSTYCEGWDLKDLLIRGFRGVEGKIASSPPKHFSSALGQIVNFFFTLQGESAGAQALSNFDTLVSPFIKVDRLEYAEIKQLMQEFIFNLNVPTRVGFQSPFSNLSMDLIVPNFLKREPAIIDGKPADFTYGECQEEMNLLNKAFCEVMYEGDSDGRIFTFPIPTYSITREFDPDDPNLEMLWKMTTKFGLPYFQNFINSDLNPEDVRSMCCRLQISNSEIRKRGGGLFGSNPLTGCYDDKTEILTSSGWKLFKDLTIYDDVFTLREDNHIELHKPDRTFEYDYDGEMLHFKAKSLDLLVTPNHNMVVDMTNSKERRLIQASEFNCGQHRIPKKSIWDAPDQDFFVLPGIVMHKCSQGKFEYAKDVPPKEIPMDLWLKFFGFWLAEGSLDNAKIAKRHGYRVGLSQNVGETYDEVLQMMEQLPFNFGHGNDGKYGGFCICNKQLWDYLSKFGKCREKFVPDEIKKLSSRQLRILFDWMMKGDGHIKKGEHGQMNYWTSSKRLADDFQEIVLKLGYLCTMRTNHVNEGATQSIMGRTVNIHTGYVLGVQQSEHYRLRPNSIISEYYKGKVYCCEVPNHSVFVRRNGKVSWCGNSVGVCTVNLSRIAYLSENEDEFFHKLSSILDIAKDGLEIKRKKLDELTEQGLFPYSSYYLQDVKLRFGSCWSNHFSTIGVIGMNEACLNMYGFDITFDKSKNFAKDTLKFIQRKLLEYQESTGNLYNLEATPAEGCSYRLAKMDKAEFPDIITSGTEESPFYSNSTQLPVNCNLDLFESLNHQDELQTLYTGGTVFHCFLGEAVDDPEVIKRLVMKIANGYRMPYFTITPTFSICNSHGYLKGRQDKCSLCGERTEVYSRIVGYFRPVKQWNKGKKREFEERKTFVAEESCVLSLVA
jgi:ribonucleoside-triphosphate reductase